MERSRQARYIVHRHTLLHLERDRPLGIRARAANSVSAVLDVAVTELSRRLVRTRGPKNNFPMRFQGAEPIPSRRLQPTVALGSHPIAIATFDGVDRSLPFQRDPVTGPKQGGQRTYDGKYKCPLSHLSILVVWRRHGPMAQMGVGANRDRTFRAE